jgi:hypothetical protein
MSTNSAQVSLGGFSAFQTGLPRNLHEFSTLFSQKRPLSGLRHSNPASLEAEGRLGALLHQHGTDLADGPSGVQTLRANAHAVHDAPTAEHAERVV